MRDIEAKFVTKKRQVNIWLIRICTRCIFLLLDMSVSFDAGEVLRSNEIETGLNLRAIQPFDKASSDVSLSSMFAFIVDECKNKASIACDVGDVEL